MEFFIDVESGNQRCPDLIIVDLSLPKKSGKEVLARIRELNACEHVPLIVLTSSEAEKDKEEVAQFNPSRFLTKPTKLEAFVKLGSIFRELLGSTQ